MSSQYSREQAAIHAATKKLQQALLSNANELARSEYTHQNLVAFGVNLVGFYQSLLGIHRAQKEVSNLIHDAIDELDKMIQHHQAIEGHSFEQIRDDQAIYEEFVNLATLQNNLETLLNNRIKQLEAAQE